LGELELKGISTSFQNRQCYWIFHNLARRIILADFMIHLRTSLLIPAAILLIGVSNALAQFTRTASGTWDATAEWTPNGVPDGIGATASLIVPPAGTQTVDLSGGTFTLNQLTVTGPGAGAWAVNDGTLIFDGAMPSFINQRAASGIAVSVGANLQLNTDTTFITIPAAVTEVSGTISGPGRLIQADEGTLVLSGTNLYNSPTVVNGGTLQAGSLATLSPNSDFTVNGTLDLGGLSNTIGSLSGGGTVTNNGGLPAILTAGSDDSNTTFSGNLVDGLNSLGFTKLGAGLIALSGVNTYSGPTSVNGGILLAGSPTALSQNSAFTVNVNATLNLGGFSNAIGSLAGSGIVTNNAAPAVLTVGSDNTSTTFSGFLLNGPGELGLTKVGTGTLTLSGVNSYSGPTLVNGGVLEAGSFTALSPNSAFSVNFAVLDLGGFNNTIGSLAGNGVVRNTAVLSPATLTVGGNNSTTIFSGS